jgi:ATP-dependent Clp protease ATP-binding subunit ClpA
MGFGTSNIIRDSTDHILESLTSDSAPGLFRSLLTHLVSFNELSIDAVTTIIEMRLNSIRNNYGDKGIRLCFDKTLVQRLADTFLKLPAEKRGIESLINKEIGPRIRDAVLARTDHFQEEIEIC